MMPKLCLFTRTGWKLGSSNRQPAVSQLAEPKRIAIAHATEAFIARCTNRGIQASTLSKYKTFTKQLAAHCDNRGYVMLDQLSVDDMDKFCRAYC